MTHAYHRWVLPYPREIVLLAMILVFSIVVPNFWHERNLTNILAQSAPILILAIGQTFVLLVGGIDLAQGALVGLASVVLMVLFGVVGVVGSILLSLAGAAILGFGSGVLVSGLRVEPFIGTLAGMYVLGGITMFWTGGTPVTETTNDGVSFLTWLGTATVGVVPVTFIVAVMLGVLAYTFLCHVRLGLYLYAVGSNPRAATALGIRRRMVFGVAYSLSALFAAAAALLLTARIRQGNPHLGEGLLFLSIGGAVLGGVALTGGVGGIWAAARGVALLALIENALYLTDMNSYIRDIVVGLLLVFSVLLTLRRHEGGVQ